MHKTKRNGKIKILNCYCGIGGNRKLWPDDEIEVTAVEINPDIAAIYKDFFPHDTVIIDDAHEYLLKHFEEYDFIWSSPPCPSHSQIRKIGTIVGGRGQPPHKPIYPDMKLYEEILFLQGYYKGKWVVENVIPWYEAMQNPSRYNGHLYWSNFVINNSNRNKARFHKKGNKALQELKGFDLSRYNGIDKRRILRNCVEPESGLHIFNCAFKEKQVRLL